MSQDWNVEPPDDELLPGHFPSVTDTGIARGAVAGLVVTALYTLGAVIGATALFGFFGLFLAAWVKTFPNYGIQLSGTENVYITLFTIVLISTLAIPGSSVVSAMLSVTLLHRGGPRIWLYAAAGMTLLGPALVTLVSFPLALLTGVFGVVLIAMTVTMMIIALLSSTAAVSAMMQSPAHSASAA